MSIRSELAAVIIGRTYSWSPGLKSSALGATSAFGLVHPWARPIAGARRANTDPPAARRVIFSRPMLFHLPKADCDCENAFNFRLGGQSPWRHTGKAVDASPQPQKVTPASRAPSGRKYGIRGMAREPARPVRSNWHRETRRSRSGPAATHTCRKSFSRAGFSMPDLLRERWK